MHITLLGGFDVVIDGRRVPSAQWRRRQAAALVKLLALAPGRTLHREQVIDALWPSLYVDQATPRLHKAAHYARRALGQPRSLVLGGDTVALFPDAEVDVDAVRFQRLAESARDAGAAGEAADAYPGELLPHDLYERWTEEPRERLRLLYQQTLRRAGRYQDIVNIDAAGEPAHLELIRYQASAGETRPAPHQFERLERGPRRGLGAAPCPEPIQVRDKSVHAPRRRRSPIVLVGGPSVSLDQPTAGPHRDWPYRRVLDAVAELCGHPALPVDERTVAVIIMSYMDSEAAPPARVGA
jgi:DNA-binding SARP family transcriptional activator